MSKKKPYPSIRTIKQGQYKGWTLNDPIHAVSFEITKEDIKKAVCKDPSKCVVAQAIRRQFTMAGEGTGIEVGSNISKVFIAGIETVFRFFTSGKLGDSLKEFDTTGKWPLPPGVYKLLPLPASYRRPARWDKAKRTGKGQSVIKTRVALPTRRTAAYSAA